ncbi:MAG: DUF1343 domain-containing protein [Ferruginibacter sp.]|nr:DUF1343 domain-containing protein [Ferruginibacter sp.]
MNVLRKLIPFVFILIALQSCAQSRIHQADLDIKTAAEQMDLYLPLLSNKKVGVFANQTSMVKDSHLVDTLLHKGINVKKIFGPEHGFRGKADAGEHVNNDIDRKTGIPIISLYGNHKKPTAEDLKDLDILVFDIQDVGVRFYTFVSSLEYFLEAALENNKPLIILDRPNPNGFYVDGPVLDKKFRSFLGMQPVPIVYGLTLGEYALMLCGEKWLSDNANKSYQSTGKSLIKIIPCKNYSHQKKYQLPVNPSPNLKQMQSVYLYPSICFFEGTVLSEGRGTDYPFQIFGHPDLPDTLFPFVPKPNEGAKTSKCFHQKCYGWNLSAPTEKLLQSLDSKIQIKYLLDAYKLFPGKDSFFLKNNFFNKLAGNDILMDQIKKGYSEADIRKSWEPELTKYNAIRRKYLLYD